MFFNLTSKTRKHKQHNTTLSERERMNELNFMLNIYIYYIDDSLLIHQYKNRERIEFIYFFSFHICKLTFNNF